MALLPWAGQITKDELWTKWKFASGTPLGSAFTNPFIHLALNGRHIAAQGSELRLLTAPDEALA